MTSTAYPFGEIDTRILTYLLGAGFVPKVIYDIGASNGSWTWTVAKVLKDATFHLFEPQFESDPSYAETIANVKRYTANVTLHPIALGAKNGKGKLNLFSTSAAASMLDPTPVGRLKQFMQGTLGRSSRTVPVHRLDDYARARKLAPPDLIKMDVQGFELEILKGAEGILGGAKVIMTECWLKKSYGPMTPLFSDIIAYLEPKGFVLIDVGDIFYDSRHEMVAVDAVFMAAGLATTMFPNGAGAGGTWRQ